TERLRQAGRSAYVALSGVDSESGEFLGAIDRLGQAVNACTDGARFDPALQQEVENLNAALAQAEESARSLRDYLDGLEADPDALERVAQRLFRIGDLKRKYGESIADILAYAEDAQRRLEELEHRAERADELRGR